MAYNIKGDLTVKRGLGLGTLTEAQRDTLAGIWGLAEAGYMAYASDLAMVVTWTGGGWNYIDHVNIDKYHTIAGEVDFTTAEPSFALGTAYINTTTGAGSTTTGQTFTANNIYVSLAGSWIEVLIGDGSVTYNSTTNQIKHFYGGAWQTAVQQMNFEGVITGDPDPAKLGGYYVLDHSGGAVNVTLPAATGSGHVIKLLCGATADPAAFATCQSGESVNGVTDGTFAVGTAHQEYTFTDIATGQWAANPIPVAGALTVANVSSAGASTADSLEILDSSAAAFQRDLPAATGSGAQVVFQVTGNENVVTVAPQAGEEINNVADNVLSLDSAHSRWIFTDVAAGKWSGGIEQYAGTELRNAYYTLSTDAVGATVVPFDEVRGNASFPNTGGTITVPAGTWRIVPFATRHGDLLDYELYNVTDAISIEQYKTDSAGTDAFNMPLYLTFANDTQIQVRETNGDFPVTFNGRESGEILPWTCYLSIEEVLTAASYAAGTLVAQDRSYYSLHGYLIDHDVTATVDVLPLSLVGAGTTRDGVTTPVFESDPDRS